MPSGGCGSSSSRVGNLNLPAGFRFHPTDEELIVHYLMNQAASIPCPVPIIAEVNIYQCNPWDLPAKALFGENEWYFFSPRDRKYPNGVRPNRAAGSGYWKATGTDKAILSTPTSQNIGVKKALVFYGGKPPKGVKTDWIMHEYRLTGTAADNKISSTKRRAGSSSMRLDDWVLCRIHKKSNDFQLSDQEQEGSTVEDLADALLINDTTTTTTTNNNNNMNDSTETTLAGKYHEQQQQLHLQTMSKSCSLTDLLNSIDYASLSQMFLDIPAEAEEPQQSTPPLIYPPATQTTHQALTANNYDNSVTNNSSQLCLPTAAVDAVIGSENNGLKKRKRVMATESFDDGSCSFSSKKLKLPSDSRSGGHFGTTASSYCNQQQLVDSTSSGFQYSSLLLSNPFFNQQQLLLNSHIGMQ